MIEVVIFNRDNRLLTSSVHEIKVDRIYGRLKFNVINDVSREFTRLYPMRTANINIFLSRGNSLFQIRSNFAPSTVRPPTGQFYGFWLFHY
jgi:hypothetical protein